jgi:hypothetical protein
MVERAAPSTGRQRCTYERISTLCSGNHCCSGKSINNNILIVCLHSCLSYPACKAHALYYIVMCVLCGSTIFFHIISQTARFSVKGF